MSKSETIATYLSVALSALLTLVGCEDVANSEISSSYSNDSLSFSTPSNWKVLKGGQIDELHYVILQGPGGAALVIQSYPTEQALPLKEYARISNDKFIEAIPIGEIVDSQSIPIVTEIEAATYTGIEYLFSISLFEEKTPHVARYYSFLAGDRTVFFKYQVESRYDERLRGASDLALSTFKLAPSTN